VNRRLIWTIGTLAIASAVAFGACSTSATPAPTTKGGSVPSSVPIVTSPPSSVPSGGGGAGTATCPSSQPPPLAAAGTRTVTIKTAKGSIVIKLEGKLGPIATGNFVALATCGYYTGVVFHRLVPGFVIQAGDGQFGRKPNVDASQVGQGGPGYTIEDEPVIGDYTRGTVAMARTPAPHSQGSQFFICLADLSGQLDKAGDYVIIGHVTAGMDTVDAIAADPNSGPPNNQAIDPVSMDTVTVATP
jgi:cyclophilin family peptidyl-prolyl cis-trans isomerase